MSAAPAPHPETPEADAPRTRTEINRANSRHSTGPRTAEGKARASMNALKHGLFSREAVLPDENREAFDDLGRSLAEHFHAETAEQLTLVQEIADCRWRARRVVARETALTVLTTEQQRAGIEKMFEGDPETITALAEAAAFQTNFRLFAQLSSAEARLHRRADAAEKKLASLHQKHQATTPEPPAQETQTEDTQSQETQTQDTDAPQPPEAGFVPPNPAPPPYPRNMPHFSGPLKKENRRAWLRKHGYNDPTGTPQ